MDRIPKLFLIIIVLSALASCGIFFTPMDGRWNPIDPKNELLAFNPTIDGYAHNVTPVPSPDTWEGDLTQLLAWKDSKIILLRFDTADFPRVVAASFLRLWLVETPANNTKLSIYRIKNDWQPNDDFYRTVNQPGVFYDDSQVTNFTVSSSESADKYIEIPLGEVFKGERDKLANGILIYSDYNGALTFLSKESGDIIGNGSPPLLLVEPE